MQREKAAVCGLVTYSLSSSRVLMPSAPLTLDEAHEIAFQENRNTLWSTVLVQTV
jgi:hypothetical protein